MYFEEFSLGKESYGIVQEGTKIDIIYGQDFLKEQCIYCWCACYTMYKI